jgi:hypothetical protein
MADDFRYSSDERTIPSRRVMKQRMMDRNQGGDMLSDESGRAQDKAGNPSRADGAREAQNREAPWALRQYLDGQIDLDRELSRRFPAMPVMSQIHVHNYGTLRHGLAHVATQDGAASLIVEVDEPTRAVQFTFLTSGMIGVKFNPSRLTDLDREHWLHTMLRASSEKQGEIAFLWGAARWESDYLIYAPRKHFTNVYAFSPLHVEAAARLTSEVTNKLVEWLEGYWRPADDQPRAPRLNTW